MTRDPPAGAPLRWVDATIARVEWQTPRVISVFVTAALARHRAGQHVDLKLTAEDGYAAQRSYSIASAPGSPQLELAVERLDEGEVSPYFHDVAQAGDTFEVRGPIGGHFVSDRGDGGPLVLIGGGSGIVPLVAIARDRAATARETPTLMIASSRTWDDILYRDELLDGDTRDPRFTLRLTTTRERRRRPADFDRRLDESVLRDILASWGQEPRHAYVCGATAFVESVATDLTRAGVAFERIRAERYGGPH